eukprot:gene27572-50094_t
MRGAAAPRHAAATGGGLSASARARRGAAPGGAPQPCPAGGIVPTGMGHS